MNLKPLSGPWCKILPRVLVVKQRVTQTWGAEKHGILALKKSSRAEFKCIHIKNYLKHNSVSLFE